MCQQCRNREKRAQRLSVETVTPTNVQNTYWIEAVLLSAERLTNLTVAYSGSREANIFIKAAKFVGNVLPEFCVLCLLVLLALFSSPRALREMLPYAPRSRAKRIIAPPGQKLLRISEFLFSPKTVTLTFKPLIADWQFEYFESLKAKRNRVHRLFMRLRYTCEYAKACGFSKLGKLFRGLAKI